MYNCGRNKKRFDVIRLIQTNKLTIENRANNPSKNFMCITFD